MVVASVVNTWTALIPLLLGFGGVLKSSRFVPEGWMGNKQRFGKAVRDKHTGKIKPVLPGWCFPIPFVEKLQSVYVRQRTLDLPGQTFFLKDHTVFRKSAQLRFRIDVRRENGELREDNLELSLYETGDLEASLKLEGLAVIRRVLSNKEHGDLVGDRYKQLLRELESELQNVAEEWGVSVLSFGLTDSDPDALTTLRIQTPAVVSANVDAVKAAATELGLEDSKELYPVLAAGLLPATSSVLATAAPASRHQLLGHNGNNGTGPHEAVTLPR